MSWIWGVGSLQGLLCLSQQQWVLVSVRDKGGGRDGPWALSSLAIPTLLVVVVRP